MTIIIEAVVLAATFAAGAITDRLVSKNTLAAKAASAAAAAIQASGALPAAAADADKAMAGFKAAFAAELKKL
jgi:hypothetical protein